MPEFIYDYDHISFTLSIPEYWSTIYRGKPRENLYHDYRMMLDKLKSVGKNKVVLDVGVNHGIFAIPAAMMGYKVIGFEPVEANFEGVVRAISMNKVKTLNVFNFALSNEDGESEIYIPECPDNASFSKDAAVANMKGKQYRTETITTMKFDSWLSYKPEFKNIGFIKIDVQGSEYKVIEGMKEFLTAASDVYMVVEYEDHLIRMGYSYEQLDNLIMSFGFVQEGKIGNDKIFKKP